jgi:hypothetical protein
MNIRKKAQPSPEGHKMLEALQNAVLKTLEKKRPLGQYVVNWKYGKPVLKGEDAPDPSK